MTTVLNSLNTALHDVMNRDTRVYVMGEDIIDPYGGAFKVTRGLSSSFPERVITSPVSEAGMVGIAAGMALRGLRPVVEIMFGDFCTLITDQLVNHITKFRWMYNNQVTVPIVIRTPMGGRRGYGPTHSQSLEKIYLGIPGLRVLALNAIGNPGKLLAHAIMNDDNPVVFIENKLLYSQSLHSTDLLNHFEISKISRQVSSEPGLQTADYAPTYIIKIAGAPPPIITIVTYGYMAELVLEASKHLAYESEIFPEIVIPTQLAPYNIESVFDSVRQTQRIIVVEEGTRTLGWGAEIIARISEKYGGYIISSNRLGAADLPIPASGQLEEQVLPNMEDIIIAARSSI